MTTIPPPIDSPSTPPTAPRPSRRRTGRSAEGADYTPLYVVAGLTDVVAAAVLDNLQQTQERAARRLAELQNSPARLEEQAKQNADELSRRLKSVPGQVKAAPAVTRSRVSELQRQLQGYRAEALRTYSELAGRGRQAVDDTLVTARNLSAKVEQTAEDLRTTTPTATPRSAASRQAAAARANAGQTADERLVAERAAARKVAAKRAAATRAANRRARETAVGGDTTTPERIGSDES